MYHGFINSLDPNDRDHFFEVLLQSRVEAVYGVDQAGRCLFANQTGLDVLHIQDNEELVGKDVHALLHVSPGTPAKDVSLCDICLVHAAEKISDWIWEVDGDGKFTYSNPRVENILGYTSEEVIGKALVDFMPFEEENRVQAIFDDAGKNNFCKKNISFPPCARGEGLSRGMIRGLIGRGRKSSGCFVVVPATQEEDELVGEAVQAGAPANGRRHSREVSWETICTSRCGKGMVMPSLSKAL